MKKIVLLILFYIITIVTYSQGYNSKWGSYSGTPYEQQPSAWNGSGIALDAYHIATNHHVIDGAVNITVKITDDDNEYRAEVVTYDSENDLAIIKVVDENFSGFGKIKYGFKPEVEDLGMDVFVLGYPLITTMGTDVKLTTGVISSRSGFQGNVSQYQVSAPVQPGNSGGPLFNNKGELIGIISAKHTEAENAGYGVKLSYLCTLASNVVNLNLNAKTQISGLSLSEQCKVVIPFTVLIIADNISSQPQTKENYGGGYNYYGGEHEKKYIPKQPDRNRPNVIR